MQGYLLNRDHLIDIERVVRAERTRQGRRPQRRRQSVFQPLAGNMVYQCVYGTRLRLGTAADEEDRSRMEPVCLCIPLGDVSNSGLRNLRHSDVRRIRDAIETSGAIASDGTVVQSAVDDLQDNSAIKNITKEQLGDEQPVRCLRTRFAQGYIGTGSVVIGNDDEVWGSSGQQVQMATVSDKIRDSEELENGDLYLATVTANEAAIDDEVTSENDRIQDYIVLRDKRGAFDMGDGSECFVEFAQQIWFDNDKAYDSVYWYEHETRGRLPIFNVIQRIGCRFTNGESETIPAYGIIRINGPTGNADTSYRIIDGRKPNTYGSQYSHFVNGPKDIEAGDLGTCFDPGDTDGVLAVYDSADGTPAAGELWGPRTGTWKLKKNTGGFRVLGVTDTTNHLVLVTREPFVRFHGVADGAISKDSTGTVSIYYGNGGSYTDTTVDMSSVANAFGDIASAAALEVVWEGDIAGVKWRAIQAECSP